MGKPARSTKNESLGCKGLLLSVSKYNWKCLHNYHWPTMKIPELRWCLPEMSFNNPSQFPGFFFKWMSKCVIYIAWREFGGIPHVKYCRRKWVTNCYKFLFSWNLSLVHFLIISVRLSFAIALKLSSSGSKRSFLSLERVQISPCGFLCEREESWC